MLAHTVAAPTAASAQMPSRPPICAQSPVTTSASAAVSASASSFCLPCPGSERGLSLIKRDLAQLWPLHAQARWLGPPSCSGRLRAPSRPLRPRAARWAARRGQADSSPMGSSVGGSWAARGRLDGAARRRPAQACPYSTHAHRAPDRSCLGRPSKCDPSEQSPLVAELLCIAAHRAHSFRLKKLRSVDSYA